MDLYRRQPGVQTRWASFENPQAARGLGGTMNRGAKGRAFEAVSPGEAVTLLNASGSGMIRRIWVTISDRSPQMLRSLRLDCYWDGAETPAVSAPLGDFFGVGLGRCVPFECDLFASPEGRSFNCFVPMPFRSGARIVLTNESETLLSHLFYEIDFLINMPHDPDTLYFHTCWRRECPNPLGEDWVILPSVHGAGRYLGCNVGLIADARYEEAWWGEGELKIWMDGDTEFPTCCGTGAEDLVGAGWGLGSFSHRTQGCPIADTEKRQWAFYRYHTVDPVCFEENCRVALQTLGGCSKEKAQKLAQQGVPILPVTVDPGNAEIIRLLDLPEAVSLEDTGFPEGWCNFYRQDDWSSVAYFYLNRPENGLPSLAERDVRILGLI